MTQIALNWNRTDRGNRAYAQALWYVWGREDAGDRRLRDMLGGQRVAAFEFAEYAGQEADAFVREEKSFLPSIHDLYDAFLRRVRRG